jgi:DNA-binding MarR family transcriptional regulator
VEYIGRALPPVQLPGLDSVEQTCWDEFHNSSIRLFAAIECRLKLMAGITLTDVRLLNLLAASDYGCFRKSEISRALTLTPSRATQLIRQLKIRRLVSQSATPYDRRGIRVGITVAGRARLEAARQIVAEVVRTHYLGGMSRAQMLMLADSHRRINAQLELGGKVGNV